jgi:hypothetical protein
MSKRGKPVPSLPEPKFTLAPYEDDIFKGVVAMGLDENDRDLREGEYLDFQATKIPLSIYSQMLGFFNYCEKSLDSEGFLLLLYRDGEWSLGCPRQVVSAASVQAHPEENAELFHGAVGDVHSHPGMGAFHSSVDDADEKKHRHGIFMVVSSERDEGFSIFTSNVNILGYARGRQFSIKGNQAFDMASSPGDLSFPEEWKAMVKKDEFKTKKNWWSRKFTTRDKSKDSTIDITELSEDTPLDTGPTEHNPELWREGEMGGF